MRAWAIGLLNCPLHVALACSGALADAAFNEEMKTIAIQLLVIHGDRDVSAPLEATGRASAHIAPNARLQVYEGAPHGLVFTHRRKLHADVLSFLHQGR